MSFKVILGILFGLMVLTITVLGVLSYQNSETFIKSSQIVGQTYRILNRAESISSQYKEIQLGSNAFVIIKDSLTIAPYQQAKQSILDELGELRTLTKGNQQQQLLIDSLESLLLDLIVFTDSAFLPGTQAGEHRFKVCRQFSRQIQAVIDNISQEEKELLAEKQVAHQASVTGFRNTFVLLLIVISVLLLATFFSVRYNFNKRIRAEDKLRRASDLSAKLFHETPVGIVISQLDNGVIVDCNKSYEQLIGYVRDELIGQTAAGLKILESPEKRNTIVTHAVKGGLAGQIEVQLKPKDRDPIWTSISMQPIRIDDHDCLLSVVMDMSIYKRAEEDIKKALNAEIELNKMKSNFVTLASHEFRTPLTTILSSSFLIENYSTGENSEKVLKHLSRIKASVNLLTSILDEFLSLSKIEEGMLDAHYEELNLEKYLEGLCQNLQTFSKPGQRIVYQHKGLPNINIDKVLLGNIVNNLVSNAMKYSPENSTITISSSVNKQFHLSVKDCGIGIPLEDQKNLFKRFYRASNAGNVQGTGLGLHIMKHYIDMLKGSIEVISEPGKGSEFKVTFSV